MNNNENSMVVLPIKKLVIQYSMPAVIAMVVNAVYNMVDRVFIGRFVGETALAGVTVVFPIMIMIMALAQLLGGGAAPLIGIRLGEKNKAAAAKVFGNQVTISVIAGLILMALGIFGAESILRVFGADDATLPYAVPYLRIIMIGLVFQLLSINISNVVRTEGHPRLAMKTQIFSALTNLVLDFIFVVPLGWGIRGAAIATITGQTLGALWLFSFYIRGKSLLPLKIKSFLLKGKVLKEMISLGFPPFLTQLGGSFGLTFLNIYLGKFGGNEAIASVGAINSLYTLFIMPLQGIQMGVLPIFSYNFGAKLRDREKEAFLFGVKISVGLATIAWAILEIFPRFALSLFLDPASSTLEIAVPGLRLFVIMLPLLGFQFIGNGYIMATNKPVRAALLSATRQFIFFVPILTLVLAPLFGLSGVWLAVPVSDLLATLCTTILVTHALNHSDFKSADKKRKNTA